MAFNKHGGARSNAGQSVDWPFLPPGTARHVLLRRWLALLLFAVLHWFDGFAEGVLFPLSQMALSKALINGGTLRSGGSRSGFLC